MTAEDDLIQNITRSCDVFWEVNTEQFSYYSSCIGWLSCYSSLSLLLLWMCLQTYTTCLAVNTSSFMAYLTLNNEPKIQLGQGVDR